MAELGSLFKNITETALIKKGAGVLRGYIINSHTSGTLKLVDGLTAGAVATTTLTSTGAMVPADYATNTLTSDATNVTAGDTVTINTTVYTFVVTPALAYDVKIGADAAGSLTNLKAAINATRDVYGVSYGAGTIAHAEVVADTLTATTLKVWARTLGTTPNAYPTTEGSTHLSWAATTLGGGTGVSDPGVTAAGATFVLDTNTYTAVTRLAENIGMDSVANQILWVTSEAVFLDNVKSAINRTGTPGVDYSSATEIHPTVFATTNAATTQVFNAKFTGTAGNSIATTKTLANYAFTSTVMASGTLTTGYILANTNTFSTLTTTGERYVDLGGIAFNTGLLAVVGGTADLTLIYD
jgi:hypothetical protein